MKKVLFLSLALCTSLLGGCKREQIPTKGPAMNLSVAFEKSETPQGVTSRAGRNNAFAANDKIGIFVVPYASTSTAGTLFGTGNYAHNVPFETTNGVAFAPEAGHTIAYPNDKTKVDIYAFAMYNANTFKDLGDAKQFAWTISQTQNSEALILSNDLMTAVSKGVTPTVSAISLTFKHRLAKVQAAITIPATVRGQNVTASKLFIDGTRLKATVDMTDPTRVVTISSTDNEITAIETYKTSTQVSGSCNFEAIVLPSTIPADNLIAHLVLTLADNSTATFECRSATEVKYTTGTQTKLNFTFENENILSLDQISITNWATGQTITEEGRRPARMIFDVAGNTTNAAKVKMATIKVDDVIYTKVPATYANNTITITYPQSSTVWGYELKSVELFDETGTKINSTVDTDLSASPKPIPGDPTAPGYATKIGVKITF